MNNSNSEMTQKILEAIRHRCGQAVKFAESEVGNSPNWRTLRPRLLGVFGNSGLVSDVRRIMSESPPEVKGANQ